MAQFEVRELSAANYFRCIVRVVIAISFACPQPEQSEYHDSKHSFASPSVPGAAVANEASTGMSDRAATAHQLLEPSSDDRPAQSSTIGQPKSHQIVPSASPSVASGSTRFTSESNEAQLVMQALARVEQKGARSTGAVEQQRTDWNSVGIPDPKTKKFSSYSQMMEQLPTSFGIVKVPDEEGNDTYVVRVVSVSKLRMREYRAKTAMHAYYVMLRYSHKKWSHLCR